MKKSDLELIKKTIKTEKSLMIQLLVQCWNDESPHFRGKTAHKYIGDEVFCCYCNRSAELFK